MNRIFIPCLTFLLAFGCTHVNQPTTHPTTRPVPFDSPVADKRSGYTFTFRADHAQVVQLMAQWQKKPIDLSRDAHGNWTVHVANVPGGLWEYSFNADGVWSLDPMNSFVKPSREPRTSMLDVPSNPPALWEWREVPSGTLHTHEYVSSVTHQVRSVVIYTPPGHRADGPPLPVLYLLHGLGDNERVWSVCGRAHWMEDHLIAEKKAVPMIIVMPDSHVLPWNAHSEFKAYAPPNTDAFIEELENDVRPLIEKSYRVRDDAGGRAFAGLSMGGEHALTLAMERPGEFAYIAAFSPVPPPAEIIQRAIDDPTRMGGLRMFWIPIGKDDHLVARVGPMVDKLRTAGIHVDYDVTDGDHSWPVWRNYLGELLPRLFKDNPRERLQSESRISNTSRND